MAAEAPTPRVPGSPQGRIPLLDAAADLATFLSEEERSLVERVSVPVLQVPKGPLDLPALLERRAAFAAIVLDGLVLHQLAVGGAPGLRIIGTGDVIARPDGAGPSLLSSSRHVAQSSVRLALLGNDFLAATSRAPRITLGLEAATAEQVERLFAQLAICQLPRVADRVLAMLWLLADSFGRVTPAGTRLPLSLTHEVLGALVGARRPTVTLALGELSKRGAVVHQDGGWLLLEPPVGLEGDHKGGLDEVQLLDESASDWAAVPQEPEWDARQTLAALSESVSRLREQHESNVEQVRDRLRRIAISRQRSSEVRERILAGGGVSRRRPPSS